jgi:glucokinase
MSQRQGGSFHPTVREIQEQLIPDMIDELTPVPCEFVVATDLGGTHLRVAVIDRAGNIHAQMKRETPKADSPEVVLAALVSAARGFAAEARFKGRIVAASIMVPGVIDKCNAIVVQAPNLSSLNGYALKAALENDLGWPVVLENDANAAAVGEMWLGAARGFTNVICVTLGTGVGGGIILDGKLWRGTDGSAGELGHTTVDPFGGPKCRCGNTGCLEMFASATAIVRMTGKELLRFPGTILRDQQLTAEKVYVAGLAGDELALEIFKRVGVYLGIGLANLINVLGPEVIVIAGGVANGWKLFAPDMREEIAKRAIPSLVQHVQIKPAQCGDNAGLLGAARLGFENHKAVSR